MRSGGIDGALTGLARGRGRAATALPGRGVRESSRAGSELASSGDVNPSRTLSVSGAAAALPSRGVRAVSQGFLADAERARAQRGRNHLAAQGCSGALPGLITWPTPSGSTGTGTTALPARSVRAASRAGHRATAERGNGSRCGRDRPHGLRGTTAGAAPGAGSPPNDGHRGRARHSGASCRCRARPHAATPSPHRQHRIPTTARPNHHRTPSPPTPCPAPTPPASPPRPAPCTP